MQNGAEQHQGAEWHSRAGEGWAEPQESRCISVEQVREGGNRGPGV